MDAFDGFYRLYFLDRDQYAEASTPTAPDSSPRTSETPPGTAVDLKIEEQAEFVAWWRETVRGDGRPSKTVAVRGQLSATDAESLTGITKQQVSRWAKALEARDWINTPSGARGKNTSDASDPFLDVTGSIRRAALAVAGKSLLHCLLGLLLRGQAVAHPPVAA